MGSEKRSEHLEQVARELKATARADFAFVLSRKGKLLTADAPQNMPAVGREGIVEAIDRLHHDERTTVVTLPREQLVPFGGAGLVDVYAGVAAEVAVVCAVLATWTDTKDAVTALVAGLDKLEALIDERAPNKRPKRAKGKTVPPPKPTPRGKLPTEPPPRMNLPRPPADLARRTDAGLGRMGGRSLAPRVSVPLVDRKGELREVSFPEIRVRDTTIGRETMAAIDDGDGRGPLTSAPASIELGDAPLGRESLEAITTDLVPGRDAVVPRAPQLSGPAIEMSEARLSNASLAAVRAEAKTRRPASSAPELELGEAPVGRETHDEIRAESKRGKGPEHRTTQPYVEQPGDAKRTFQAQRKARRVLPPRVTVKLEEIDLEDVSEDEPPLTK